MQRSITLGLILTLFFSCSTPVKETDLAKINGFWEIEKVELSNGEMKEYKINEEVEQIEFKDGKGIKRKVIMLYSGNFFTNNIKQEFTIEAKENNYFILNKTDFSTWKEEIEKLTDSVFLIKNEEGIKYHYRKRNDIKLEKNGETN